MRVSNGVWTRSITGDDSVKSSASVPKERMNSSRLETLCERQAATPTPHSPIIINVMPTKGTMYVACMEVPIQILILTMRRTIQNPSAISPAVKMSTMSPAPCNMGSR